MVVVAGSIGAGGALTTASPLLSQSYPLIELSGLALTCTPTGVGATQATL
jgi:hypothetical protein